MYDLSRTKVIEQISFDGLSLISPSLRLTVSGATSYSESVGDVAHSIRVYKGKIFILVRVYHLSLCFVLMIGNRGEKKFE